MNMGLTAEYLAAKYRIPREKQDAFALRSHQLAAKATDAGEFKNEIIPTWGRDEAGRKVLLTTDQCIRRESSLESLSALPPAFNPDGGSVTAGNSSPINVGAAALLDHVRGEGPRAGLETDRPHPRDGRRRRQSRGDGHRARPGDPESTEASRAHPGSDRLLRVQRSVRRSGPVRAQAAGARRGEGQSARRCDRHRPSPGCQRGPDRDHALAPDARPGGEAGPGVDVYRPGAGSDDDLRAASCASSKSPFAPRTDKAKHDPPSSRTTTRPRQTRSATRFTRRRTWAPGAWSSRRSAISRRTGWARPAGASCGTS